MYNNDLGYLAPQPYKPKYDFTISARKPTFQGAGMPRHAFRPQEGRFARVRSHFDR